MHKVAKPEQVVRAVGVYEWTGDLTKPTASRLIPVSIFIDGKLEDAGVYVARPVPFALLSGNVYALQDAGIDKGLQYLGDFGHELFLIQVWNEEDRNPPWTGELELEDGETNQIVKLQFDDEARVRYTKAFDEHCSVVQQLAFRTGG